MTIETQMCLQFADLLWRLSHIAPKGLPEARIVLCGHPAREVSTHEPGGLGVIALAEEAVRILVALHGEDSPLLLPKLKDLFELCASYADVVGANDAAQRGAALAARVLQAGSPLLADAREKAESAAEILDSVLSDLRRAGGSIPAAHTRRAVQLAALEFYASGEIPGAGTDGLRIIVDMPEGAAQKSLKRAKKLEAESARAAARLNTPCTGCGASPGEGAPAFKRCAACQAVAYCTRECQKAHWKKAHKRECATLAGAAPGGGAANAPSA